MAEVKNQTIAAIDIGSNSIKLSVVQASASDSFIVVLQERERIRLGEMLNAEKILPSEALQKVSEVITRFRLIAENRKASKILAVATASVREALNGNDFVQEIEKKTGVKVEVLSAVEEARLIGLAAARFHGIKDKLLLNIDIGGGSTELSLMRGDLPEKLLSFKLGSVSLKNKFLFSDPPKEKELKQMRSEIRFAIMRPVREMKEVTWDIVSGTSGTILNLVSLADADRKKLSLKKLIAINEKLCKMTNAERATLPSISPSRAEVIISGGCILEEVMKALKIDVLQASGYALREGVIIDYLKKIETEQMPSIPSVEDLRLKGIFAIGRRYGYEEKHALQVACLAEKIFDGIAPFYKLKRSDRILLSAAALLHNIGYYVSHESHHKHTLYLIKHSEIIGFSESEKLIIANIARYHRGKMPQEKHPDFAVLREREKDLVWKLGGILRLANALDRSYESRIKDLKVICEKRKITILLVSNESCELELEAVNARKDMFEKAFGCKLMVALERFQNAFQP
ncbi:MAG: Ppx/GppA family phosphatase [Acidobacteria bacterium]|jgi:exopolyphosphatase/guanosine-5'-triphosphate,3'-diphosphate pyrophosphatase|nr:MAG: Ppx/GppA family phosphatase [Acidobacteriota bacterium]GIU82397.1 MAG: exopolyphosphatase [Pyrinomonadaceae bacterium]